MVELSVGDLSFRFDSPGRKDPAIVPAPAPEPITDQLGRDSLRQDELSVKSDQLAMMLIEDPLGYERLMLAGELEEQDAAT